MVLRAVLRLLPQARDQSRCEGSRGIPDERWGEKAVAAVVTKTDSNIKPEAIRAHCKKNLHDWKCPKKVVFVKALPRNTMGKVLKEKVKALCES